MFIDVKYKNTTLQRYVEETNGVHCPSCGEQEVWVDDEDEFYCVACETAFKLYMYGVSGDDPGKQIINAIREGKT